ncbi:MAG: hypothetical protein ACD_74C00137G0003 [uncultured bacterium]|nr:MAG: hypothetical protein ACD_74C00137G0003 [uncultured bacterium]
MSSRKQATPGNKNREGFTKVMAFPDWGSSEKNVVAFDKIPTVPRHMFLKAFVSFFSDFRGWFTIH